MAHRSHLWSGALSVALFCAMAWLLVPGECVVCPYGSADAPLGRSLLASFVQPFANDWTQVLHIFLKVSPIGIVLLAFLHWKRGFRSLRVLTAFYALVLAAAVAFHPYRMVSDTDLIAIVGIWGIVILVADESKASPGSALLALISIQIIMSELYSGLGADRGAPFWMMTVSMSVVFSYGIFHYSRTLRHRVLGRYTEIRPVSPEAIARRDLLAEQRRRLEGGS